MFYIIADDLTGANDTGVQFAKNNCKTMVLILEDESLDIVVPENLDVFVIDTETRETGEKIARKRIKSILEKLNITKEDILYKKVDSTLRGNVGVEIAEIMDILKKDICIFSPSFPSHQRISVGGYLLVQQKPLGFSEYADSPSDQGDNSFIPLLLKKQTNFSIGQVYLKDVTKGQKTILSKINALYQKGNKIIVIDATNEQHLRDIFASGLKFDGSVLLSGSAGLAHHFSQIFTKKEKPKKKINNKGPIMVVVGSRNPLAMTQIEYLKDKIDFAEIKIDLERVFSNKEETLSEYILKGVTAAKNNQHLLIYTDAVHNLKEKINKKLMLKYSLGFRELEVNIKKIFGEMVLKILQNSHLRNLILTGGDVALGVCKALDISNLTILDELLPGIPLSITRYKSDPLNIMTKAGGFGQADTLYELMAKFKNYGE